MLFRSSSMMQMAKDIADYSPDVTFAESQAEIADMFAQMRRAEALGPDMAEFIEARSDFMITVQDFITEISPIAIEFMTAVMVVLNAIMETINDMVVAVKAVWNSDALKFVRDSLDLAGKGAKTTFPAMEQLIRYSSGIGGPILAEIFARVWRREKEKDDFAEEMKESVQDFLNPNKLIQRIQGVPGDPKRPGIPGVGASSGSKGGF